jgi:hypothetical protein
MFLRLSGESLLFVSTNRETFLQFLMTNRRIILMFRQKSVESLSGKKKKYGLDKIAFKFGRN